MEAQQVRTVPPEWLEWLKQVRSTRRALQDIHPLFSRDYPVAFADSNRLVVFEAGASGAYEPVRELPAMMPIPAGLRAAFPIPQLENRAACVVTPDIVEQLDGIVTALHEFVHCWQSPFEPALKSNLAWARQAAATGNGMLELDYPFPYADQGTAALYRGFLHALDSGDHGTAVEARHRLAARLAPADFEYMAWQEWKEGFARWVENRVRARLGLALNDGGRDSFSRVSFYAGGAALVENLYGGSDQPSSDPVSVLQALSRPPAHIHGTVADFEGRPLAGAEVVLKRDDFSNAGRATADAQGAYSLLVPAGRYNALAAVRGYQTENLEYWAWDVRAEGEVTIDCRVDGLELYGIHAWRPSGAAPSYLVYVRPMSLQRCARLIREHGPDALGSLPVVAISPELSVQDVAVQIDGQPVAVLAVSRVAESAGPGRTIYGWLVQVGLPAKSGPAGPARLSLELTDRETGERGAGCVFLSPGP